jgi:2-dehydropantoate 2-reductase
VRSGFDRIEERCGFVCRGYELIIAANKCGYNLPSAIALEQMKCTETMGAYSVDADRFIAGCALEVEAIWGEPLRRAWAAGVEIPRLEQLYALLKSLNRGKA